MAAWGLMGLILGLAGGILIELVRRPLVAVVFAAAATLFVVAYVQGGRRRWSTIAKLHREG